MQVFFVSSKSKTINRKERKGFTQSTQRTYMNGFDFANFAPSLRALARRSL
jgi:hypothetical protein